MVAILTSLLYLLILLVVTETQVSGHGRMMDPPQRSSLWRFPAEFPNSLPNYNDMELFCGGFEVQHHRNRGRCGECGDPYHLRKPRDNEHGGRYGNGVIARTYHKDQIVTIDIELTASHAGYFRFNLCPHNYRNAAEKYSCFERHPLSFYPNGLDRYWVTGGNGHYYPKVVLPSITCRQCVLQWTYKAGNSWGVCSNGTEAVGCGPQETFRGCADIAIY